jgi:hypothetical protein
MKKFISIEDINREIDYTNRTIDRKWNHIFQPFGLTGDQFFLLWEVSENEGITAIAAFNNLDLEKEKIPNVVAFLSKESCLTKKGRRLYIDPKEREIVQTAMPVYEEWHKTF